LRVLDIYLTNYNILTSSLTRDIKWHKSLNILQKMYLLSSTFSVSLKLMQSHRWDF